MTSGSFIDGIPLWLTFAGTVVFVLGAWYVGYVAGKRARRRAEVVESLEGEIVGAVLGLVAFMLAFTFGMAESRWEARRIAVLDEAVALRTAYLRAGLQPATRRDEVRALLREYVAVRIEGIESGRIEDALRRSAEIQRRLWGHAIAIGQEMPTDIGGLSVESLNAVVDSHVRRLELAVGTRIPTTIWFVLYLLVAIGMALVGHHAGMQGRRPSAGALGLLAFAFAVVLFVISLAIITLYFRQVRRANSIYD